MQTTIILVGEDARLWTLMKGLQTLGAFDVKYGSVEINFDGNGKISNVKITKNYRQELST